MTMCCKFNEVHLGILEAFHSEQKISTLWWRYWRYQGITKVNTINLLGTMNVCVKCGSTLNSCWDILVQNQTKWQTEMAIQFKPLMCKKYFDTVRATWPAVSWSNGGCEKFFNQTFSQWFSLPHTLHKYHQLLAHTNKPTTRQTSPSSKSCNYTEVEDGLLCPGAEVPLKKAFIKSQLKNNVPHINQECSTADEKKKRTVDYFKENTV